MTFLIVRIEVPYNRKCCVSADVLKVEEITYENNILKDINFDVREVGDVIGLVGKNGVGKNNLTKNTHEDYSPYQKER